MAAENAHVSPSSSSSYRHHFGLVDYVTFSAILLVSLGSGIYFGYYKKPAKPKPPSESATAELTAPPSGGLTEKRKATDFGSKAMSEYLLGSRKLRAFPVAMSLIGSYVSAVTILGTPSEIYNYGTQYWLIIVPIMLMCVVVCQVYLPVFCALKVGSSYEYLEMRFDSRVRSITSVLFVMDELFFLPIIIYVPSMAFNQVTGINLHICSVIICLVCISYTIIGGIKAVVFTDSFQVLIMFIAVLTILIVGSVYQSGANEIFERADEGGRLIWFNMSFSMYERHTFWGVLIGGFSYWLSFNSVNQTMVQRYMTLPNLRQAKISVIIYTVGVMCFVSVCCFAGILIYAHYIHCDPLLSKQIDADDQLFPLYVMDTVGHLFGFPGLFIAGVVGAALSSLSVVLNSTAAVILEDLIKATLHKNPSERATKYIVKGSIAVLGLIAMALVLVVERLGGVLVLATSLTAIASGTSFGAFTLGMLVPRSNSIGAIAGMLAGGFISAWISLGSQIEKLLGRLLPHKMGVWMDGCAVPGNSSMIYPPHVDESEVFFLHRLSFLWINPISVLTVLVVGTVVSYATGARTTDEIDPELISPVIHRFLPTECFNQFGNAHNAFLDRRVDQDQEAASNEKPTPNILPDRTQ